MGSRRWRRSVTRSRWFRTRHTYGQTGGQEKEDTLRLHADVDGSAANEATAAGQSSVLYESATSAMRSSPPLHNISDGFPIALRAALQSPPAMRDAYKLAGALCPFRFRFRCPVWTWIPFPIRVRIRNSADENETENCTGKPDRREGPVVVTFCFWVFPAPFRPIFAKSIRLNARLRCSLVIYYVTRTLHWSARDGHWVP